MARASTFLLVLYAAVALTACFLVERVMFQPPPPSYAEAEFAFRRIGLEDADSIAVLYLPADRAGFTILYSHGNAEDLGHVRPLLVKLHRLGFGVIGYDYRGYGRSSGGTPTSRRAVEDAEAVYRFAIDGLGIQPDRLILHGRSVGSGPTLELATRHRVAGVILESAFTSVYRVITRVGVLPFDRFPNVRHVREVRCPVLVIHGTHDRVIPISHGRRLFAMAPEPKQSFWVDGAGHNDLVHTAGGAYAAALARFTETIDRNSGGRISRAIDGRR